MGVNYPGINLKKLWKIYMNKTFAEGQKRRNEKIGNILVWEYSVLYRWLPFFAVNSVQSE